MNITWRKIYVKAFPENNELIYTGIEFAEFMRFLTQPIENIMIITGGCVCIGIDTRFERKLELFEGPALVEKLTQENVHSFGNFCFVDYVSPDKTSQISEQQIAELLYMGFMFQPLHSPFFEPLQNRFAYLAHDDGWFCRLYCRSLCDFMTVLCKKIISPKPVQNIAEPTEQIKESMLELATDGLLIDLGELSCKSHSAEVKLYTVGEYSDMDEILNYFQNIKDSASRTYTLSCNKNGWHIE